MALVQFMRPSLRKGAYAALSSATWQEIRVRSGRDDKGEDGALREDWLVAEKTAGPCCFAGPTCGWFFARVCGGLGRPPGSSRRRGRSVRLAGDCDGGGIEGSRFPSLLPARTR